MIRSLGIRRLGLLVVVAALFFSSTSRAQGGPEETKGTNSGNYNVQQTVELGYRGEWVKGNQVTYDTFVNLGSGVRLLNYTLDMRSLNHQGLLFDNLYFSNFGYGGDPDDVSRLRIEENKWYDFSLVFRRHKNFWDYNLLANPLNPVSIPPTPAPSSFTVTNPSFAVTNSPASLDLVRRMQDYKLTLLPQSRLRFRLGYSRHVNEGPARSSLHGTTDFLLAQNFRMTTNAYHVGVDFRFLPKTTISYDQFLEYNKQDTSDTLANLPSLISTTQFPGTIPVNMGLNWYYPPTATTVPCAAPFLSTGFANPTCKSYLSYSRTAPARNFMPTERLSFQSTYFRRLKISGSASYNSSNNIIPSLNEVANEWTNPSAAAGQIREAIVSGPANAKQVFVHANGTGIYSLTQKVRIVDSVSYDNWRNSGVFNQVSTNLFATLPQVTGQTGILLPIAQFGPLVPGGPTFTSICPGPTFTAITCPQHGTTSAPDVYNTFNAAFLGQKLLSNTIHIEADFTKRFSGRVGYFYEKRQISETPWDAIYASSKTVPNLGATYYPGGTGATATNDYLAARGACAFPTGSTLLPVGCTLNVDGSITYTPSMSGSRDAALYCSDGTHSMPSVSIQVLFLGRCETTINEQVALAGLTLRPMDTLRINADFQFGYNDASYTRIQPRQVQSYKIRANYRPRVWATIDGTIDIHENRDNVSEVNDIEHVRTYSFSTVLAPNPKLAITLGYNYTNINLQTFICFRDSFGTITGPGVSTFTPTTTPCPFTSGAANSSGIYAATDINLGTLAFYSSNQHFAYGDVMWKPMKRMTTSLGYAGTFVGGSTVFLNPLQPAGTLAFNYQKPFASIQVDVYKGLSYKTTWNYYGYNAKAPFSISVPITGGTLALMPVGTPDFNGSTVMFAIQYAF